MHLRRPDGWTALTALVLLAVGAFVGASVRGLIAVDTLQIEPEVQSAIIVMLGALLASGLAGLGTYWGSIQAANAGAREGDANRREARRNVGIEEKNRLVRLVAIQANRHAHEVLTQINRRAELHDKPYAPLPKVGKTTDIEDACNALYALGFQSTGDRATALLNAMQNMDLFVFEETPENKGQPIVRLSREDHFEAKVWNRVQLQVKTEMIQAGLVDQGVEALADAGTLPETYLLDMHDRVQREMAPAHKLVTTVKDAMADKKPTSAAGQE